MFQKTCNKLLFPQEVSEALHSAYTQLIEKPEIKALLDAACASLLQPESLHYLESLAAIYEKTEIPKQTVDMVMLVMAVEPLASVYREKNLPEELLWESMADLRCKLFECKGVYDIWGTFVTGWFKGFYTCDRFKLGRLEYEIVPFEDEDYRGIVKKGDPVINCHIPSDGPLTRESVMDSLCRAFAFYKDLFPGGIMPVRCGSWMLYPPVCEEVFREGSNLRMFYELFDVNKQGENPANPDFWRIFNCFYSPEALDTAPADTTLRRDLLRYLKDGKTMGWGRGMLLYDGEKILK